ncbi:GNAT family N-acetyltransferase [Porticoccaceae bacterium]|nr:GNAT family N-acetyltransferase [Porticoccaceae bacterium]
MINYRLAIKSELTELKTFLFDHGQNPWNYLPVTGVDHEFNLVSQEKASILLAIDGEQMAGFAIFYHPEVLPNQYLQYSNQQLAIYIAEVVIHRQLAGQSIGHKLLSLIIEQAPDFGASLLLIDRHEENLASAGMMRKAGFAELRTFVDLERRDYGSRKTTVMAYQLS